MRHVPSLLTLGICSAQTVPLTRATADLEGDVRLPDFIVDACGPVISLAYNPNTNTLTSEDAKHGVALWRVQNGQPVRKVGSRESAAAEALTGFSPDGAQAASIAGVAIRVTENRTSGLLVTPLVHIADIRPLTFSPNGRTTASAGDNGAIRLWAIPLPPLGDLRESDDDSVHSGRNVQDATRSAGVLARGCHSTPDGSAGREQNDELLDPRAVRRDYNEQHGAPCDSGRRKEGGAARSCQEGVGVVGIHAAIDTFRDG